MRLRSFLAVGLVLAASLVARADSVSYTFDLTPYAAQPYGGTAAFTITSAPGNTGSPVYYDGVGLTSLSFLIDGQTFDLSGVTTVDVPNTFVEFQNGSLYDVNFAETIGSGLASFTLDTTGQYAFYYHNSNGQDLASYGDFTNLQIASAATPEPSSLLLLGTGLLGFAGVVRRKIMR